MARSVIPGRPLSDGDRLNRRQLEAKADSFINQIHDTATRQALSFLVKAVADNRSPSS